MRTSTTSWHFGDLFCYCLSELIIRKRGNDTELNGYAVIHCFNFSLSVSFLDHHKEPELHLHASGTFTNGKASFTSPAFVRLSDGRTKSRPAVLSSLVLITDEVMVLGNLMRIWKVQETIQDLLGSTQNDKDRVPVWTW